MPKPKRSATARSQTLATVGKQEPRRPSPDPSPLSEAGVRALQFCRKFGCHIGKGVAAQKNHSPMALRNSMGDSGWCDKFPGSACSMRKSPPLQKPMRNAATRDTRDFDGCGLTLINPWQL
jgi:hypothetical protein